MDTTTANVEEKYKKLATEYSKLRAQASVLKKAVLEEQNKNGALREALRVKETNLRRVEQEVDSLGFRNKQLEHRVETLQDDLDHDNVKKIPKNTKIKTKSNSDISPAHQAIDSSIFSEELQKKIIDCAQLTSIVDDKSLEIQMQTTRINELEHMIRNMSLEESQMDGKLRKEIERLLSKNQDLEAKLVEASSILGSDETLYVSECEQHQKSLNNNNNSNEKINVKAEDRLAVLEKDMVYWRTQYEILQITTKINENERASDEKTNKTDVEPTKIDPTIVTANEPFSTEEQVSKHFSKKIEDLFMKKCMVESKLAIYTEECISLQKHLEIANTKFAEQEKKLNESQRDLQRADEDLATTRINYEEQISVLTEQVISLSDQLAALK